MPSVDEVDSGIEAMSASNSREDSPSLKIVNEPIAASGENELDDDEDLDETLLERLWGLTEMFPECVRNGTWKVTTGSISGLKSLYSFSRSAMWILVSSSAILLGPIVFEVERMQFEEIQRQQQRQILLGPSAAVSGSGMHNIGIPMPSPSPVAPTSQR